MSRRDPRPRQRGQRVHLPRYWAPALVAAAVTLAVGFAFSSLLVGAAAGVTVGSVLAWEQRHSRRG